MIDELIEHTKESIRMMGRLQQAQVSNHPDYLKLLIIIDEHMLNAYRRLETLKLYEGDSNG